MSDPYFQKLFAERIGGENYGKSTEIYKFEKIKRAKRAAIADFPERALLDFGIGENDSPADSGVCGVLAIEAPKVENRGYADNGIIEYRQAAARFMKREFGVELNPETQINHAIGSKSALALIPAAFINPGDVTLMTTPGYPVAGTWTKYLGGEVYNLELRKENNFFPQLENVPADILKRVKLLVINYPNSPTGKMATRDFYLRVIEFARKHKIVVVQDAAHMMLSFAERPLSFLEVEGAMDVGVEVHSMSKGFDMIGWRMAFVAGNERIVSAFADVKDNTDSGQFIAVQKAATAALDDASIPQRIREKYRRRQEKLVNSLRRVGFDIEMPDGTYFLYAPAPVAAGSERFSNAEEASQFLIRQHSICTVPWDNAGAYLRFSATYQAADEQAEDALMVELEKRMGNLGLTW